MATWTIRWSVENSASQLWAARRRTTGVQLTVIRAIQLSVSTSQGGSYQDTFQAPDNDSRNAVIWDTGETITGLAPSSLTLII